MIKNWIFFLIIVIAFAGFGGMFVFFEYSVFDVYLELSSPILTRGEVISPNLLKFSYSQQAKSNRDIVAHITGYAYIDNKSNYVPSSEFAILFQIVDDEDEDMKSSYFDVINGSAGYRVEKRQSSKNLAFNTSNLEEGYHNYCVRYWATPFESEHPYEALLYQYLCKHSGMTSDMYCKVHNEDDAYCLSPLIFKLASPNSTGTIYDGYVPSAAVMSKVSLSAVPSVTFYNPARGKEVSEAAVSRFQDHVKEYEVCESFYVKAPEVPKLEVPKVAEASSGFFQSIGNFFRNLWNTIKGWFS